MTIANLYRQLKQVLDDSNTALVNRGFMQAGSLSEIPEIVRNNTGKLRLLVSKEITSVTADDLDGATVIRNYAFVNCKNLTSVTIPEGVTAIGKHAFENCTGLRSVIIPKSVTTIEFSAFRDCKNLSIYIHSTTPPWIDIDSIPVMTYIYVPKGYENAYKQHSGWSKHSFYISEMQ